MKARIIRPGDLDAAHRHRWRAIIGQNDIYRNPFYAPEFTDAIASARGDAFVAVLEDAGETVGFLPFHRLRSGVAKPIGGPISDYQGPILAPEFDPAGEQLLAACNLAAYDFNHLPKAMGKFSASSYAQSRSPLIDLSGGYTAYEQGRRESLKQTMSTMARRRRKLEREIGPVRFLFQDETDAAYEWLKEMKALQFKGVRTPAIFDVAWVANALENIRKQQSTAFAGVVSTLYAGERLMAAHFGMRSASWLHWWFPTYDRSANKYSSGILLLLELARHAHQHDVAGIDLGRGDEPYKMKFSNGATDLCEGTVERAATLPGLLRKGQKTALSLTSRLPLGRYESYPRRAFARLISGMQLPPRGR